MQSRYFHFILFLIIFTGCCEQNDLALRPTVAPWLPYSTSQRLVFINEVQDTLRFTTAVRQYKQHATDQVCGDYAIETKEVILKLEQDTTFQVQVKGSHEVIVSLNVYNKQTKGSNLFVQYNSVSKQIITDPWRDRSETDKKVNGQLYPQVLHVYGNSMAGSLSLSDVLYAPTKGLIGFKVFNGGWYYLREK